MSVTCQDSSESEAGPVKSARGGISTDVMIPLRCVLALAFEVARNAVDEVRWHRAKARADVKIQGAAPAS